MEALRLLPDWGIPGDAHAGDWHRQLSLLGRESVRRMEERIGFPLAPVACLEAEAKPCARAESCRTLPLWQGLDETVRAYLGQFTLRSLMRE